MARRARNPGSALRAPFPWFGGKRRVADVVWRAFGNPPNYIEPFAGSLAVLLARPSEPKIETVNDVDCYLSNFFRAIQSHPEEVARWADWPVSEVDLHARHRWLVGQREFRERMRADPDYCYPKVAGWWVWGICQWIGDGWCRTLKEQIPDLKVTDNAGGKGVHSGGLPYLRVNPTKTQAGQGIHAEGFQNRERALKKKIPSLKNAGQGVHMPSLGNDRGVHGVVAPPCSEWFALLRERLRRVRVACGDWERVLGPSVLGKGANVGGRRPCAVFLDPPYSHDFREGSMYAEDQRGLSDRVREWAVAHGDDPDVMVCLAGYEGEHEMPVSWTKFEWKAARGYAGEGNDNASRERLWFSPTCLPIDEQRSLFG